MFDEGEPDAYLDSAERDLHRRYGGRRMCFVITDPNRFDNPIVYASAAFLRLTGYPGDAVLGLNCRFLQQGQQGSPDLVRDMERALAAEQPFAVDLMNHCRDGTPFCNRLRVRPAYGTDGKLMRFLGFQSLIPDAQADFRVRALPRLW